MDKKKIEEHIKGILIALGDDPEREGLKNTPKRVANMFEEVFEGIKYTNEEIAKMYDVTFEDEEYTNQNTDDFIFMKDIEIFSYCEHHLALMYNMKVSVAYIPNGKIIGLSKIARIADMVGKRLQVQERIGEDIADVLSKTTDSKDIAVIIEAEHSCMTARGIRKTGTKTYTTCFKGSFKTNNEVSNRLMGIYNK